MAKIFKIKNMKINKNYATYFGILLIITLLAVLKFDAEVFDVFGLLVFSFFLYFGLWMLNTKKETPDWIAWVVLLIGIIGLVVDGGILIKLVTK